MEAKVYEVMLPEHRDDRGNLIALEAASEVVPFEVKRIYYIFDTQPGNVRGNHAHKTLRQMLICLSGSCRVICEMPDGSRNEHEMNWPNKGLVIEGMVWREMKDFSKDAVLVVLASEHYDENDYIRDYREFLKFVKRT